MKQGKKYRTQNSVSILATTLITDIIAQPDLMILLPAGPKSCLIYCRKMYSNRKFTFKAAKIKKKKQHLIELNITQLQLNVFLGYKS